MKNINIRGLNEKVKEKKGVSLIVLVITIIIVIILAGITVISLSQNAPIGKAKEATFKNEVTGLKSELEAYIAQQEIDTNGKFKRDEFNASGEELEKIMPSIENSDYLQKVEIVNGKLVYIGNEKEEENWAKEIEVSKKEEMVALKEIEVGYEDVVGKIEIAEVKEGEKVEYFEVSIREENKEEKETKRITTSEKSANFSFEGLKEGTVYYLEGKVVLESKEEYEVNKKEIKTKEKEEVEVAENERPEVVSTKGNKSGEWIRGEEVLKIENTGEASKIEYKIDDGEYEEINRGSSISVSKEGETRITAKIGEKVSETYYVRIDNTEPEEYEPKIEKMQEKIKVEVNTEDKLSGIESYRYYIEGVEDTGKIKENSYEFGNLEAGKEYKIIIEVEDKAGNVNKKEILVNTEGETYQININVDKTNLTNENVKVSIEYVGEGKKEYRIETAGTGSGWKEYEGEFKVDKNATIYVRIEGKIEKEYKIENIDKLNPTKEGPSVKENINSLELTLNQKDAQATSEYASSGLDETKTEYGIYLNGSWVWQKSNIFEGLEQNREYEVRTRVIDKVGNGYVESEIVKTRTKGIPGGSENIKISPNPTTNTKGNVEVSITYKLIENTKGQYRVIGNDGNVITNWTEYKNAFSVTKNGRIEARIIDDKGQTGTVVTMQIANIDKLAPTDDTPSALSTENEITVTLNQKDASTTSEYASSGLDESKTEYGISTGGAYTWQKSNVFSNLTPGVTYKIKTKATDKVGNTKESKELEVITTSLPGGEENIKISQSPEEYTNKTVEIQISYVLMDGTKGQYRVVGNDGSVIKDWTDYTGKFTVDKNCVIEGRIVNSSNQAGEVVRKEITNIDKLAPKNTAPTGEVTSNSITVKIAQDDAAATTEYGKSGIDEATIEYGINKNGTWVWQKTSELTGLTQNTTYQVKTRAKDKAGNGYVESNIASIKTGTVPGGSSNITIKATPTAITKGNVEIEITYKQATNTKGQYRVVGNNGSVITNWTEYKGVFEVEKNGRVEARMIDTSNQSGTVSTLTVTNIDKLGPTKTAPTATATSNSIKVTLRQDDAAATTEYGKSGLDTSKTEYGINQDGTWIYQTSNEFTYLKQNTEYEVRTKATDKVGNVSESEIVRIRTTGVPGGSSNITINATPTTNTNGNVTVSITYKLDNTTRGQYRIVTSEGSVEKDWTDYTGNVVLEKNRKVEARIVNTSEEAGEAVTKEIKNIDKLGPTATAPSTEVKKAGITVTSNQEDAEETVDYIKTGIEETSIEYAIKENGVWSSWQKSNVFTNIKEDITYEVKTRAKDKVGNGYVESETTRTMLISVPGGPDSITITTTPTGWTNQNVSVKIEYRAPTGIKGQYRIVGTDGRVTKDWTDYTAEFTVDKNCKIEARMVDEELREGEHVTKDITNIDKTAPTQASATVSGGTAGSNGWYKSNVTVRVTQGTDNESGVNRVTYALSGATTKSETTITSGGTFSITAEGTTTVTVYTYDNAGNKSAAKTLTVKKDSVAPTQANATVSGGTAGSNGWYKSNVTVRVTQGSDATSGVNRVVYALSGATTKSETTITNGGTFSITAEGTTKVTVYTYDNAGNKSTAKTLTVKKDATAPTQAGVSISSGTPGYSGWYKSNIGIRVTQGTDSGGSGVNRVVYALSGAMSKGETTISNGGTFSVTAEGTTTITVYTYDNAGNKSAAKTLTVKKDTVAPTYSGVSWTNNASRSYWTNTDRRVISFTATDNASGILQSGGKMYIEWRYTKGTDVNNALASYAAYDLSISGNRASDYFSGEGQMLFIRFRDVAGNYTGWMDNGYYWRIDKTAPFAPYLTSYSGLGTVDRLFGGTVTDQRIAENKDVYYVHGSYNWSYSVAMIDDLSGVNSSAYEYKFRCYIGGMLDQDGWYETPPSGNNYPPYETWMTADKLRTYNLEGHSVPWWKMIDVSKHCGVWVRGYDNAGNMSPHLVLYLQHLS